MNSPFELDKFLAKVAAEADGADSLFAVVVTRRDGGEPKGYTVTVAAHGYITKKDFVMAGREVMLRCEALFPRGNASHD